MMFLGSDHLEITHYYFKLVNSSYMQIQDEAVDAGGTSM